jgi:branched-chain amino acid transport system substrate-binding protein
MVRILITLLVLFAMAAPAQAADPMTIDVILPMTGPTAFFGKAQAQVLQIYENIVNGSWGIHGQPVHFDIHDDQSSPVVDVQIVQGLLPKSPTVILGTSVAATAAAVVPLVPNGPVFYSFSNGILPPAGSYVFSSGATLQRSVVALFVQLKALGYKRIAVLSATDASGQRNFEFTRDWFASSASRGVDQVSNEQFSPTDVSTAAQAAKIRASNPDVVVIWASGTAFGTALRDLVTTGLTTVPVATTPANANPDQLAQYANFLPKALIVQGLPYQGTATSPALKAAADEYLGALKQAGLEPSAAHAYAWDPTKLVVGALRALPAGAKPAQLRAQLAGTHDVAGLLGMYDFRPGDQRGLGSAEFPFIRWVPERKDWVSFNSGPGK